MKQQKYFVKYFLVQQLNIKLVLRILKKKFYKVMHVKLHMQNIVLRNYESK